MHYMIERLEQVTAENPGATLVASRTMRLTAQELLDSAKRFGVWLRRQGISEGNLVALDVEPELQIVLTYACYLAGLESCIPPRIPGLIHEIGCSAVISWREQEHHAGVKFIQMRPEVLVETASYSGAQISESISSNLVGNVFFSSGTTGRVKGIRVTAEDLELRVDASKRQRMFGNYMSLIGLGTYVGFITMLGQTTSGKPYYIGGDAGANLKLIKTQNIDTILGSPVQLEELLDKAVESGVKLNLARVQSGGLGLSRKLAERLSNETGAEISSYYAATEVGMAAKKTRGWQDEALVGDVLEGVKVQIVGEDSKPLPDGQIGRIRIATGARAKAYLHASKGIASEIKGDWFYPGDYGFLTGRSLSLSGREFELVNAGGVKVNLMDLDRVVQDHPGVSDAAAFTFRSEGGVVTLGVAFVSKMPISGPTLKDFCVNRLGASAPSTFLRVSSIPRGELSKPNRQELSTQFSETLKNYSQNLESNVEPSISDN